jgi:hypothetical protein
MEAIMSRRRQSAAGLPIVQPRAGAIDIGSRFHVVAVPPELSDEPVQTFQAFTGDLERMGEVQKWQFLRYTDELNRNACKGRIG